jgi:hypothetical protein
MQPESPPSQRSGLHPSYQHHVYHQRGPPEHTRQNAPLCSLGSPRHKRLCKNESWITSHLKSLSDQAQGGLRAGSLHVEGTNRSVDTVHHWLRSCSSQNSIRGCVRSSRQ